MCERKRRSDWPWIVGVALTIGMPAFYVLSVGPACLLRDMGYISQATIIRVYAPLVWLDGNSTFAKEILNWYVSV